MLNIKVNGNRSDISAYLSFYTTNDLSQLLSIHPEEITFEDNVNDYFIQGDITVDVYLEIKVTMSEQYLNFKDRVGEIIVAHAKKFSNYFKVYFEIIKEENLIVFHDPNNKKDKDCDCENCDCDHDDEHCHCEDCDCEEREIME